MPTEISGSVGVFKRSEKTYLIDYLKGSTHPVERVFCSQQYERVAAKEAVGAPAGA